MSCLFHSLSYFFKEDCQVIRNKICDYLQQNKPIIEGIDTREVLNMETPHYISNMRKPSTWGGAIEIQVACTLWNVQIHVFNHRDQNAKKIVFVPLYRETNRYIQIYWTGGHYEPIK